MCEGGGEAVIVAEESVASQDFLSSNPLCFLSCTYATEVTAYSAMNW